MSPRDYLERRTGMLWGTYRWHEPNDRSGPPPRFGLVVRPPNDSWMRVEVVLFGRAFYLTWGHQA